MKKKYLFIYILLTSIIYSSYNYTSYIDASEKYFVTSSNEDKNLLEFDEKQAIIDKKEEQMIGEEINIAIKEYIQINKKKVENIIDTSNIKKIVMNLLLTVIKGKDIIKKKINPRIIRIALKGITIEAENNIQTENNKQFFNISEILKNLEEEEKASSSRSFSLSNIAHRVNKRNEKKIKKVGNLRLNSDEQLLMVKYLVDCVDIGKSPKIEGFRSFIMKKNRNNSEIRDFSNMSAARLGVLKSLIKKKMKEIKENNDQMNFQSNEVIEELRKTIWKQDGEKIKSKKKILAKEDRLTIAKIFINSFKDISTTPSKIFSTIRQEVTDCKNKQYTYFCKIKRKAWKFLKKEDPEDPEDLEEYIWKFSRKKNKHTMDVDQKQYYSNRIEEELQ